MSVNYGGRARVAGDLGESVGLVGSWREMREVGERTKGAFFSGDPKSPLRRREKNGVATLYFKINALQVYELHLMVHFQFLH